MPRRRFVVVLEATLLVLLTTACPGKKETTDTAGTAATSTTSTSASTSAGGGSFQPVPLPNPSIPGYAFPEPEPKIVAWTEANDQKAISVHAWGIWTALTTETNETFDNQKLRVFETWQDPADLIAQGAGPTPAAATAATSRVPRRLARPHQFQHGSARVSANESTVLAVVTRPRRATSSRTSCSRMPRSIN